MKPLTVVINNIIGNHTVLNKYYLVFTVVPTLLVQNSKDLVETQFFRMFLLLLVCTVFAIVLSSEFTIDHKVEVSVDHCQRNADLGE